MSKNIGNGAFALIEIPIILVSARGCIGRNIPCSIPTLITYPMKLMKCAG